MSNISFDEGFKEYIINNDKNRIIRINPSDIGIIDRAMEAKKNIDIYISEHSDVKITPSGEAENANEWQLVTEFEKYVRDQIDYIFGADVAETAFGKQSAISTVKGVPLYQRFVDAVIPEIKKAVEEERKASSKRVSKYTKAVI